MDTLSKVSEYLNNLEDFLDDGDSLEARKIKVEKSKKKLEMFEALGHKSVVVESEKHKVVVFTKAPPHSFSKPFMRFSTPCGVDGQGAWDAKLDKADSHNYMTEEMLDKLGFVRFDYGDYERKMVNEVRVEIHGFTFLVDFVVIGVETVDKVGSTSGKLVKMGKAIRNKSYNVNKLTPPPPLKIEEIPPLSSIAPQPVYHQLSQKQKEKIKEALDRKKKLDDVMMGRARLSNNEFGEEDKIRIVEHGLPKKICEPRNFMLPVSVNGTVQMNALVNTRTSVNVLPFCLCKNLGLAYLVDFLMLDIPVDKELPLLLGCPFLRTCGAVIDMGRGTMSINDGVIRQTYFPKPRAKAYLENFKIDEEDDWLGCFKIGCDEDGNPKYGPVAPSFLDIEDEMEKALAMEAYFNPFKNIIVFKKLVDFLGSLPVQLKNTDWGNEGYGMYKKIEGDRAWHSKFEVITPSGRKFTRGFKTKEPRGSSPESSLRRTFSNLTISSIKGSSIQDK
ncbi:hypothetical protein Tco_1165558 [Tanacetum coccineum]